MKHTLLPAIMSLASLLPSATQADLTLTVDIFTSDELKFTISGTFNADVIGDQQNWLAVKSDYQNNVGNNVNWIDNSVSNQQLPGPLTVLTNTLTINGGAFANYYVTGSGDPWGDSFFFNAGFNIQAGDTVSGLLHVQGAGLFDPATPPLELASGFINSQNSWARFEGTAIPEPATGALFSAGLIGIALLRRRKV